VSKDKSGILLTERRRAARYSLTGGYTTDSVTQNHATIALQLPFQPQSSLTDTLIGYRDHLNTEQLVLSRGG